MAEFSSNFRCNGKNYNATISSSYPIKEIKPDLYVLQDNVLIAIVNRKRELGLTGKIHTVIDACYSIDGENWIGIDVKELNK